MAIIQAWIWMTFVLFTASQPAKCETFHIIPSTNYSSCPGELTGEPCITLSQFTSGEYRQYFIFEPSEIILQFQPGRHTPGYQSSRAAFASQLVSFTMNSVNSAEIDCQRRVYRINHVQNVYINGINFSRCSYQIESVMNLTLENSEFSQVQYSDNALMYIRNSSATIKGCNFTNNNDLPVPLHIHNSSTELHHTNFINNNNKGYFQRGFRGALLVDNTYSIVNISHCNFTDNRAEYGGGAIFTRSSLSIQHSSFKNNRVSSLSGSGGAIYAAGINIAISISQSEFVNNSVQLSGSGGAVFLDGNGSNILITESTMNNNSGARCGALSITDIKLHSVKIEKSIFTNNSAITSSGGVACIRSATVSILNSIFSHNRAGENAGVFAVDDSEVRIQGSSFDNNLAVANGGVIATKYFQTTLLISYTSFIENQANKQGGAIYLGRKGSQVKISKSTISLNNASRGGFITVLGSSLEITSTNIFNNTAGRGEVISACNSNSSISIHLFRTTDPVYSVCTLFSGDINVTDSEVIATTEALADTTTSSDTPTNTDKPTSETTTTSATISLLTEPSTMLSVYFELNGKVYPNNSVITLSDVGENESALLCKTDLVTCCGTLPNRFGEFFYPSGDTVSVKNAGHGFYRNRGVQEVRLNRREGFTSPTGKFRCAVPDASGTIQNMFIHLLS